MGDRETALITGASAGIGEALAHCFAKAGFDLVLVARSQKKLEDLAQALSQDYDVQCWVIPADLSKANAVAKLEREVTALELAIDALVNNAGILEQSGFTETKPSRHLDLLKLNVVAVTDLLARFVPPMVERGQGRVLNVGSIAAFQPVPFLATYAATKSYVLSLTESLSEELRDTGVTVTALCPGITATDMVSSVQQANDRMARLPGFLIGDARSVAQAGFQSCMDGETICVPGVLNLAGTLASRASPRWLVRRIAGFMGRRSGA